MQSTEPPCCEGLFLAIEFGLKSQNTSLMASILGGIEICRADGKYCEVHEFVAATLIEHQEELQPAFQEAHDNFAKFAKFNRLLKAIGNMDPSKQEVLSLRFPGEEGSLILNILALLKQGNSEAIAFVNTLTE